MLVSTKLHIPPVRSCMVNRPRLMLKLNEGMEAKLTLLSAQAGYGKTTALSEWVKQKPSNSLVAWVSLDKRDNDWMQFWRYVTASIQEKAAGFGEMVGPLLTSGLLTNVEPVIAALLNELNQLTGEWVIILDDYHVIELPSIQQSMVYFIEHLPPHIHLYIASRGDLTIPTARLLAKGEMQRINMQDLRFQLDEGLLFFQGTTDLTLTREQVKELFDQTEGWISGLQLAAISLKRSDNIAKTIKQFSGHQHHISDYLLEEVFLHQSEQTRAFLLDTSILSRMNRSLCQAVTGQINCQEQLERLEQLNLFIIPLDEERSWYRYHNLLTDFLQQQLLRTDPQRWVQVHIAAANWLENHGYNEEAIDHYLEGQQTEAAVRLIEKSLQTWAQTKSTILIRWVERLPEDSFAEKPMIELFYISVLLGVGYWEAAFGRVKQAEIRYQDMQGRWNDEKWEQAMGNVYFFCSVASYLQKDLERTSAYMELVERYLPDGSILQTMGRNRYQGYESFDDHLSIINDLDGAHAFLLKWTTIWNKKKEYPFAGCMNASYSKLLYERNQLDEAELIINQVLGRPDMQPFARILIQIAISASRIQQAKGNWQRASELLEQLKRQIDSPDYELFMLKIEAEQAYLSVQQGALQPALAWLDSCNLTHTDEISLNRVSEYLCLARVLGASKREDEALVLLERLFLLLEKEDRLRDRIKVLIIQSVIHQHLGQTKAALLQLEKALQLAEPEGYIRSFIDEGPIMAELLAAYMKERQGSSVRNVPLAYVRKLLQACDVSAAPEEKPKEWLTEQETKVLWLIADGLSNKEAAKQLNITGETVKFHIKNVYRKLGVGNRIQALQRAKQLRIID